MHLTLHKVHQKNEQAGSTIFRFSNIRRRPLREVFDLKQPHFWTQLDEGIAGSVDPNKNLKQVELEIAHNTVFSCKFIGFTVVFIDGKKADHFF